MMASSNTERQWLIIEIFRKNEDTAFDHAQIERELVREEALAWWMENLGGVKLRAIGSRQDVREDSVSGEIDVR